MQTRQLIDTTTTLNSLPVAFKGDVVTHHAVKLAAEVVTTLTDTKGASQTNTIERIKEGIVSSEDLVALEQGAQSIPASSQPFFLLTQEARGILIDSGYHGLVDTLHNKENPAPEWFTQPYTFALKHGGEVGLLLHGSHEIKTLDGRYVAQMHVGEYIHGHFDNAHYDLEKAAAHLLARQDVTVYKLSYSSRIEKVATTVKEAISEVPYYNNDNGRSRYIHFNWHPTQRTYDSLMLHAQKEKFPTSHSNFWKFVFEKDALGLRAAGAALFTSYYDSIDMPSEEDEDD